MITINLVCRRISHRCALFLVLRLESSGKGVAVSAYGATGRETAPVIWIPGQDLDLRLPLVQLIRVGERNARRLQCQIFLDYTGDQLSLV